MGREKILITVKTYPTLSKKYGETVCTAGVRADGSWIRIYPVPFRRLEEEEQYKKFDWIETDFIRGRSDPRPETHHPADMAKMLPVGHMGTSDTWRERREFGINYPMHFHIKLKTRTDGKAPCRFWIGNAVNFIGIACGVTVMKRLRWKK
jgi:hypothetical protein